MSDYEEIRLKYKPRDVKRLFIGESRPISNVFFYLANSDLHKYTKQAFEETYGDAFSLSTFMNQGYWLCDVCEDPVNGMTRALRRQHIVRGIPKLLQTIKELKPDSIIVVKKGDLRDKIKEPISDQGYLEGQNLFFLPFPNNGHQVEYRSGLIEILKQL